MSDPFRQGGVLKFRLLEPAFRGWRNMPSKMFALAVCCRPAFALSPPRLPTTTCTTLFWHTFLAPAFWMCPPGSPALHAHAATSRKFHMHTAAAPRNSRLHFVQTHGGSRTGLADSAPPTCPRVWLGQRELGRWQIVDHSLSTLAWVSLELGCRLMHVMWSICNPHPLKLPLC